MATPDARHARRQMLIDFAASDSAADSAATPPPLVTRRQLLFRYGISLRRVAADAMPPCCFAAALRLGGV